ncbi:hypothetical protein RISK_003832 [Rhodopirellula islandica]|uniref:Uncharacterized protein n=1 Tax=Rhodopirellula islandica TaxID=595434 RepID=A0A0J1BCL7_RHOIS|nr:hypothetical protein RISK_003832 [Rhodopirellula islandica]
MVNGIRKGERRISRKISHQPGKTRASKRAFATRLGRECPSVVCRHDSKRASLIPEKPASLPEPLHTTLDFFTIDWARLRRKHVRTPVPIW